MKKKILFYLVLLCGFTCGAQEQVRVPPMRSDIVMVRVVEQLGTLLTDGIYISDGKGTNHVIELSSLRAKNQQETTTKLTQVFNQLKEQRYNLISSNSGGSGSSGILVVTNYIFQKE